MTIASPESESTHTITILICKPGRRLAKRYVDDPFGDPESYDGGYLYRAHEAQCDSFDDLIDVLRAVQADPRACVIRGAVRPAARETVESGEYVRRLTHDKDDCDAAFESVPRSWIILDYDKTEAPFDLDDIEGSVAAWRESLPKEVRDARAAFFLSAQSHRSETVRGKLVVDLAEPIDEATARAWSKANGADASVHGAVQPNYFAEPVFEGCVDPLAGMREPIVFDGPPAKLTAPAPAKRTAKTSKRPAEACAVEDLADAIGISRWRAGNRIADNAWLHLCGWAMSRGYTKDELGAVLDILDVGEDPAKVAEHRHILANAIRLDGPGGARDWLGDAFDRVDGVLARTWAERDPQQKSRARRHAKDESPPPPPPDDMPEKPILQSRTDAGSLMLWTPERGYQPVALDVLRHGIESAELPLETRDGAKPVAPRALVEEWGCLYGTAVYDFAAVESRYEPERDRVVIGYPCIGVTAAYDAEVDAWLHALGGDKYDRLAQWLASCGQRYIDRLSVALVLMGEPGAGKTLLATALAGLWGADSAVPAGVLMARFNGVALEAPIVLDDEAEVCGGRMSTKQFRETVQSRARRIEKKGREAVMLRGALRLAITCNSITDIHLREIGGRDVLTALSDRMLVVTAGAEARSALAALLDPNGSADVPRITAHLAWLVETVELPEGQRFVGGGDDVQASHLLECHTGEYATILETFQDWLAGGCGDGAGWGVTDNGDAYAHPGSVADALANQRIDAADVRVALLPFTTGTTRPRTGISARRRCLRIDVRLLAAAMGLPDEELSPLDGAGARTRFAGLRGG